uniref:Uncharacterized protein n=1 Tax=Meloidogyne javanica TaxID=6303 RepID=A0A915LSA1_MELJA
MEKESEEALLKIYAAKRRIELDIENGLFALELNKLYIFFFKKQFLITLILYSQLYNKIFNEIQEEERQFTDYSFFLTSLLSEMNKEIIKIVNESNGKYEEIPQFEGYEENNRESAGRNDSGKEEEIGNSLTEFGKIFRQPNGGKNAWQEGVGNNSNNVGKEIRKSFGGKKYGEVEKVGKNLNKAGQDVNKKKNIGVSEGIKKPIGGKKVGAEEKVGNNSNKVADNKINKQKNINIKIGNFSERKNVGVEDVGTNLKMFGNNEISKEKNIGEYNDRKASFGGKKVGEKIRNTPNKVGNKEKNIGDYKEVGETSGVKKVGNNFNKVGKNKINKETPKNKLIQRAELEKRNTLKV